MRYTTVFLLFTVVITVLGGCTGWYSRYFERAEKGLRCTGRYCFSPRVVSYKNEFGEPDTFGEHGYWISIKVYDTSVVAPEDIREEGQKEKRTNMAGLFKDHMLETMRFDSLIIRLTPQDTSISVSPDTSRYTPRDIDYLSYNFGKVIIPEETETLVAVFHYRVIDESTNLPSPDSVLFDMVRIEERTTIPGLQDIVGQGPQSQSEKKQDEDD